MRSIKLNESDKLVLEKVLDTSPKQYVRDRAQCILKSNQGLSVRELAKFYSHGTNTIRGWFDSWLSKGVQGLQVRPGRGLKPAINQDNTELVDSIREEISLDPHNLRHVVAKLNEKWGMSLTVRKLKRFLKKKLNYTWRRLRKCIKKCQDPAEYARLVEKLCEYLLLEELGQLKIYYADESGFSLDPSIPYGWQPPKEYVSIIPKTMKRLNIFGLLTRDNELHPYTIEHSIDSDVVIAFLDNFAKTVTMKTVIVLDNASIHHSDKFKAKLEEWKKKDITIFYLPTYSPHLNIIETLWRKMKYSWLKPNDYLSKETLLNAIDGILNSVGKELKIDFKELKYFTEYKAKKEAVNSS